ncbi:MAG: hypothetical protein F4060_16485 [Holophagales bacterium]|nr:hypothetical protein [Holophagales bacterium]MYG30476.1 hypothetical protein [Holophagales bacterium]MYI81522.1 hypothetical protein [Holophagales bacterium]
MSRFLNLAARPFVNRRPWRRLTALLWALGLALLTLNAVLYWGYLTGSADARAELAGLREQLAGDQTELDRLSAELARLDLEGQNREVAFLNERIADRRFPWGQLFNDIEQVLPWNTRLRSLAPERGDRNRRRRAELGTGDRSRVVLDLTGEARDDQGLLDLIDALFEHPAFDDPKLLHESRQEAGPLDFTIAVVYLPGDTPGNAAETPATSAVAPAEEGP